MFIYLFTFRAAALLHPQFPHVWPTHRPAHRWGRAHPRYPVRVQALHARRRTANFPKSAPHDVDLRRRAAPAREAARDTRRGGADRVARGPGEQAERDERLIADAPGPAGVAGQYALGQVEDRAQGEGRVASYAWFANAV